MKILTLFLTIYFLCLIGLTCTDKVDFNSGEVKIEKSISKTQSSETDTDFCSPFCSCACCVGFTKPSEISFNFISFDFPLEKSFYSEKKFLKIFFPLFQPPKF